MILRINQDYERDSMQNPLLACCNFIPEVEELRQFALDLGFQGIDWTFTLDNLPDGPAGETELARALSRLYPLEVRYHLAFLSILRRTCMVWSAPWMAAYLGTTNLGTEVSPLSLPI